MNSHPLPELYEMLFLVQHQNRGILPSYEDFRAWFNSCNLTHVFFHAESVVGAITVSSDDELGFIIHPAWKRQAMRQMLPVMERLSGDFHMWIDKHNSVVLKKAMRLGFRILGGDERSYFLRRN